jgi:hypothetical protein
MRQDVDLSNLDLSFLNKPREAASCANMATHTKHDERSLSFDSRKQDKGQLENQVRNLLEKAGFQNLAIKPIANANYGGLYVVFTNNNERRKLMEDLKEQRLVLKEQEISFRLNKQEKSICMDIHVTNLPRRFTKEQIISELDMCLQTEIVETNFMGKPALQTQDANDIGFINVKVRINRAVTEMIEKGGAFLAGPEGEYIRIEIAKVKAQKCNKCCQFGHNKYECKSIQEHDTCFKCGKHDGHQAANCTTEETDKICGFCGEKDHMLNQCLKAKEEKIKKEKELNQNKNTAPFTFTSNNETKQNQSYAQTATNNKKNNNEDLRKEIKDEINEELRKIQKQINEQREADKNQIRQDIEELKQLQGTKTDEQDKKIDEMTAMTKELKEQSRMMMSMLQQVMNNNQIKDNTMQPPPPQNPNTTKSTRPAVTETEEELEAIENKRKSYEINSTPVKQSKDINKTTPTSSRVNKKAR